MRVVGRLGFELGELVRLGLKDLYLLRIGGPGRKRQREPGHWLFRLLPLQGGIGGVGLAGSEQRCARQATAKQPLDERAAMGAERWRRSKWHVVAKM